MMIEIHHNFTWRIPKSLPTGRQAKQIRMAETGHFDLKENNVFEIWSFGNRITLKAK
jgi:hypothetical protein